MPRQKPATPKTMTVQPTSERANGHMTTGEDALIALARIVVDIERKEETLAQLGRRIDPLRPLRMVPVEGEIALQQGLSALLQQARDCLRDLAAAEDETRATDDLDNLKTLLGDVQWELIPDTFQGLATKEKQQDELVRLYKAQVESYRVSVNELRAALDRAANVHAPVRDHMERLRRLDARLMQADRTLVNFEQPFPLLAEAVKALKEDTTNLDDELKIIGEIAKQTERYVRNADLLLMQSPLDLSGRYQYEVSLRGASEAGSHGVSIQSTVKLVQQDRELMQFAIKQITAVVTGNARKASPKRTDNDASVSDAVASANADFVENESTRAQIRAYIFGDEEQAPEPAVPLTSLVREMGDLMFRLFMPEAIQDYLRSTACSITLATNDLELPWEFMYYNQKPDEDGTGPSAVAEDQENFLCLNRPIARRLMGRPLPNDRRQRVDRPPKRQFLFIANPSGDLPGAEREVETVVKALKSDWDDQIEVTELRGKDATGRRLNQMLRSDRFDVIHYSGHAFFDDNDPDYSGLLLHNREIFFADKIRRLLGGRPLVFLNACESARTSNESRVRPALGYHLQLPAQGLAASFVYGGALGCIGSLWPINDQRAALFAVEFYNQVLEGHMIGEAMRRARVQIKSDSPDEITWAAFSLYGDPTFRLVD